MKNKLKNLFGAVLWLLAIFSVMHNASAQSSGRIFFNSLRTTSGSPKHPVVTASQIFSINSDGSGLVQLTGGNSDSKSPSCSPDGNFVAFVRDGVLTVMESVGEANGGRAFAVAPAAVTGSDWSPDGGKICFLAPVDMFTPGFGLWIVDLNPSSGQVGVPFLVRGPHCLFPSWSPDGTKIAYTDGSAGNSQQVVKVLDLATGSEVVFDRVPSNSPQWSPDGSRIAFSALNKVTSTSRNGKQTTSFYQEIFMADANGSRITQVTDLRGGAAAGPTWSPDGAMLCFRSDPNGTSSIFKMNLASGAVSLLSSGADDPDWAP